MKYQLGQFIKHVKDPVSEFGEIVSIVITKAGVLYTTTVKEFDRTTRELVDAVIHVSEGDAISKEEHEANEETQGAEGNPGEGV